MAKEFVLQGVGLIPVSVENGRSNRFGSTGRFWDWVQKTTLGERERRIAEGLLGCDHPLLVSSRAAEDVLYLQARGFSPVDVGGSLSFFLCQSILPPGDC